MEIQMDEDILKINLFSNRAKNALYHAKIYTFGKLLHTSTYALKDVRGIGKTTCEEIINTVHDCGYSFCNECSKEINSLEEDVDAFLDMPIDKLIFDVKKPDEIFHFLKSQNTIYTLFDFVQLNSSYFSFASLNGYHRLTIEAKREIYKKIEEIKVMIPPAVLEKKIEEEIGPIEMLRLPISMFLLGIIADKIVKRSSIRTVRELLQLSSNYNCFQRFTSTATKDFFSKQDYLLLTSTVQNTGLKFADERLRMRYQKMLSKEEILSLPISAIGLSIHDSKILALAHIHTVCDLCALDVLDTSFHENSLFAVRGVGENNKEAIQRVVHELGLFFHDERRPVEKENSFVFSDDGEMRKLELSLKIDNLSQYIKEQKKALQDYQKLLFQYYALKEEKEVLDAAINEAIYKLTSIKEKNKIYKKR